jgi:hypothetical protein
MCGGVVRELAAATPPATLAVVTAATAVPRQAAEEVRQLRLPTVLPAANGDESRFDAWPDSERANAYAVEGCESTHGEDPETYNLNAPNGGVMQINKAVWADYFWETEGWTWEEIVLNDVTNHRAARIIFDRAGGTWQPWSCAP